MVRVAKGQQKWRQVCWNGVLGCWFDIEGRWGLNNVDSGDPTGLICLEISHSQ